MCPKLRPIRRRCLGRLSHLPKPVVSYPGGGASSWSRIRASQRVWLVLGVPRLGPHPLSATNNHLPDAREGRHDMLTGLTRAS